MLFKEAKDWKEHLPPEDEQKLNDILQKVARYKCAYRGSSDTKIAQLWCAVLEARKERLVLQDRIRKLEAFFDAIRKTIDVQENEKKELIRSLERF